MNKKLYLASFLCFFAFSDVASMDPHQKQWVENLHEQIKQVKTGTSEAEIAKIKKEMSSRIKTDSTNKIYRALSLKLHSDHNAGNLVYEDFMKTLNNAKDNRDKPEVLAPEEIEQIKKNLKEIEQYVKRCNKNIKTLLVNITNIDLLSKPVNRLLISAGQGLQELSQFLVKHIVETFFTLISDRYIMVRHPEKSAVQKNMGILRENMEILMSNQDILRNKLKMYKDYKIDLEKAVVHYDKAIKRKLTMRLPKENK